MAFIRRRRLFWTDPTDTDLTVVEVYAVPTSVQPDAAALLAEIDARQTHTPIATVPPGTEEYFLEGIPEDTYNFAIVAGDESGNFSDPVNIPEWVAVPLDVSPPAIPTNLGIE